MIDRASPRLMAAVTEPTRSAAARDTAAPAPLASSAIIEVIGPAGAGKSTLVRMLCSVDERIRRGRSLRGVTHLSAVGRRAPHWLPAVARLAAADARVAREYARHIIRVASSDAVLLRDARSGAGVQLLDEGPVFSMALMVAFNERSAGYAAIARYVDRAADRWSSILDAIVWLDADDDALIHRIRARAKAHRIKASDDETMRAFLRRYRDAYDAIVDRLRGVRIGDHPPRRHDGHAAGRGRR